MADPKAEKIDNKVTEPGSPNQNRELSDTEIEGVVGGGVLRSRRSRPSAIPRHDSPRNLRPLQAVGIVLAHRLPSSIRVEQSALVECSADL